MCICTPRKIIKDNLILYIYIVPDRYSAGSSLTGGFNFSLHISILPKFSCVISLIIRSHIKYKKSFNMTDQEADCPLSFLIFHNFILNIYLFICLFGCTRSLLWHTGSLVVVCGIQFPHQGSTLALGSVESQPLDPQGSPLGSLFFTNFLS